MTTLADVVCAGCGCVCDDLKVTTDGARVTRIEPPCPLAERWFQTRPNSAAAAWIGADAASIDDAVQAAATLLRESKTPLVFGSAGIAAAREAVKLADRLGGVYDPGGDSAATVAFQQVGKSTATLGEIRQRSELILVWGADPLTTHPRWFERYLPPQRTLIVLDPERTATADRADLHLPIAAGTEYATLAALRALLAGIEPDLPPDILEPLRDLCTRMKSCRGGTIWFGPGLTRGPVAHATIAALYSLTRELNASTRFYVSEFRGEGGAAAAATWQTGYAGGVDFSRGFPRAMAGEFSAEARLLRGEADCCVLLGDDAAAGLSAAAHSRLAALPCIILGAGLNPPAAAVRFATGTPGVDLPGVAYRMDDVPLPLRAVVPGGGLAPADLLARLYAAL